MAKKKIVSIQLDIDGKSGRKTLDDIDRSFKSLGKTVTTSEGSINTFAKKIQQSNKLLSSTSVSVEQVDIALNDLAQSYRTVGTNAGRMKIANQIKELEALKSSMIGSSVGFDEFAGGAGKSTSAVVNFNRVIQDAPYGIIGVANNIDPLVQSFLQLKSTTGSTGKALKTLITSAFTGPNALITLFSLASTAAVIFSMRMRGTGEASSEAADDVERFSVELKTAADYLKSLTEQRISTFTDEFETTAEQAHAVQTALNNLNEETAQLINKQTGLQDVLRNNYKLTSDQRQVLGEQLTQVSGQLNKNELINKLAVDILNNKLAELKAQQLIDDALEKALSTTEAVTAAYKDFTLQAERQKDIFLEEIELIDYAKMSLEELINLDYNIPEKMFPPGSLGALKEELTLLNNELSYATDPSKVEALQLQIVELKSRIAELTGEVSYASDAFVKLLDVAAGTFFNSLLLAKEYNTQELELRRFNLKKQRTELKNSLDNELISRQEYVLRIAALNNDLADTEQAINEARESRFKKSLENMVDATKQAVREMIAEFARTAFVRGISSLLGFGGVSTGAGLASALFGFADGVTGFGGGVAMVGERGPELVSLPQGSNVITNQNTESIISAISRQSTTQAVADIGSSSPNIGAEIAAPLAAGGAYAAANKFTDLIPGFADGVTNYGGVAMVGERGPELVSLPQGSNVITNQNTESIISAISRQSTTQAVADIGSSSPNIGAEIAAAFEDIVLPKLEGEIEGDVIRLTLKKSNDQLNRYTSEI